MRSKLIFLTLLTFSLFGYTQNSSFSKGVILDSVKVTAANETYALYIPEQYSFEQLSSVVFIFEPMGRGSLGVSVFQEAADTFGHLLICSNNTKNFNSNNLEVTNRLLNHVFATFAIDENRIYTAGFSGGARLATTIAAVTDIVEGVIACGAGFSPSPGHTPNPSHQFSYVGLVGAKDMNYHEMFNAQIFLSKMNIENELFTNEEPHKWPDSSQIMKAMTWIELQAYKKNRKEKDFDLLMTTYKNWYSIGSDFEESQDFVDAVEAFERVERNFSRYYHLDSVSTKIVSLKASPRYRYQVKTRIKTQEEEQEVKEGFFSRFHKELNRNKPPKNLDWWSKALDKFTVNYIKTDDPESRGIGYRVRNMLYATAIETGQVQLQNGDIPKAVYCHLLLSKLYPDKPFPYCMLANDYALLGNKKEMLTYMQLAIENGLKDDAYFKNTASFSKYMKDKDVQEVLKVLMQ